MVLRSLGFKMRGLFRVVVSTEEGPTDPSYTIWISVQGFVETLQNCLIDLRAQCFPYMGDSEFIAFPIKMALRCWMVSNC